MFINEEEKLEENWRMPEKKKKFISCNFLL